MIISAIPCCSVKIKNLLIFSFFSLVLISCQSNTKKIVLAEFNVNKFLLSDSLFVSKSGFSIYPPRNWIKTDSYNSELQKKILYQLNNKLLAIYKSDTSNCALIISELPETNYNNIKGLLAKSDSYVNPGLIWTSVQSTEFKYRTYEIIQIVFQNPELIIFKLFTHRLSEVYELDYIIPSSEINKNIQFVESSIGSIN
jgi:hypothetical protein